MEPAPTAPTPHLDQPFQSPVPHRQVHHIGSLAERRQWLVTRRNAGCTPAEITEELVASGWDADTAAAVSLQSLRSSDRQTLTYAVLTLASGLGALATATSAHLMLEGNPDPWALTTSLATAIVLVPIAVIAGVAARRAENRSRFVLWSPSRRGWFGALAVCTALVGLYRLLSYLVLALATLTGARDESLDVATGSQVLVSLAVSIPLFVWSFAQWRRSNIVLSSLADNAGDAQTESAP